MSRHPDYTDRMLNICCEEHPDPKYPGIDFATFACTLKRWHRGDHVAKGAGGMVFVRWPKARTGSCRVCGYPIAKGRIGWHHTPWLPSLNHRAKPEVSS